MQTVKLNLIPGSVMPVVNASQYDVKRQFALSIYEGAASYSLSGKSVEIRGTKPDGNGFAYDEQDGVVSVSGNTVTISTTQQMTAVGGQTMAELRIKSGTTILGTINFILDVEHSALSDDTPISETEIPVIERQLEDLVEEIQVYTEDAEAWAVGERDGEPVPSSDPTYHNNAKYYASNALSSASTATTKAGEASTSATNASNSATAAGNAATTATTKAGEASTSATTASTAATSAAADSLEAEGWATGEQNGVPVGPDSPYFHNNSAYYAQEAGQHASGGIIFKGSLAFADLPTVGMASGDEYNITDDFTTDSRFIEGAGLSVKAGTNIAWVAGNVNKWDILATGGGGADALDDLTDVSITSAADGQGLVYNGTTQEWENADVVLPDELTDELRDAEVIEGKNLLNYGSQIQNPSDNCTVLFDKRLDINGTIGNLINFFLVGIPAGNKGLPISGNTNGVVNGNIISAGLSSGSDQNLLLTYRDENQTFISEQLVKNNPVIISIPSNAVYYQIKTATPAGTYNHEIISPMICTPEEWDKSHDYVPYYVPVKDGKLDIADEQVLGSWNTLKNDATTQTIEGATFTANSDTTITINRASATANAALINITKGGNITETRESGTYYLSGVPRGSSGLTIQYYDVTANVSWNDSGNGATITVVKGHTVKVTARVAPNQTLSNVTIKPMIARKPNMPFVPYAMTNRELTEAVAYSEITPTYNSQTNYTFDTANTSIIKNGKLAQLSAILTSNITETPYGSGWKQLITNMPEPKKSVYATFSSGNNSHNQLQVWVHGPWIEVRGGTNGAVYYFNLTYICK